MPSLKETCNAIKARNLPSEVVETYLDVSQRLKDEFKRHCVWDSEGYTIHVSRNVILSRAKLVKVIK